MIDTDFRPTSAGYAEPSLRELIDLAVSYGLVMGCELTPRGIALRMPHRHYELSLDEARLLIEGALAGFLLAEPGARQPAPAQSKWHA